MSGLGIGRGAGGGARAKYPSYSIFLDRVGSLFWPIASGIDDPRIQSLGLKSKRLQHSETTGSYDETANFEASIDPSRDNWVQILFARL